MNSSTFRTIRVHVLLYTPVILISTFMVLPFLWMLVTSFKQPADVFGYPPIILSPRMNLDNYVTLFEDNDIARIVWNTFYISASSTVLALLFTSLGGYGFAKFRFFGKPVLFMFLLATMVIPPAVMMVPSFVLMRHFGWVDTFYPLIIPGAANAFGIFFFRQYISTISDELLDAARIDGASEFGIYWRIVVPIIVPGMISIGLIFFMASWNNYLGPLIYLKSPEKHTIPLAIAQYTGSIGETAYGVQMAMSVLSLLPLLVIFLAFQRRFVEGITAGAVKG